MRVAAGRTLSSPGCCGASPAGGMSLRKISAELAAQGHLTGGGNRQGSGWSARAGSLVAKLKAARDRKKAATGKCGVRRSYFEVRPDVVALAKKLHADGLSLRKISAELARQKHLTGGGKPYVASAVQAMLADS